MVRESKSEAVRELERALDLELERLAAASPEQLRRAAENPTADPRVRDLAHRIIEDSRTPWDIAATRALVREHASEFISPIASTSESGTSASSTALALLIVESHFVSSLLESFAADDQTREIDVFGLLEEHIGRDAALLVTDSLQWVGASLEARSTWMLRDARQNLSDLLREVRARRPQIITDVPSDCEPVLVVGIGQLVELLQAVGRPRTVKDVLAQYPDMRVTNKLLSFDEAPPNLEHYVLDAPERVS